ncbi:hypothetical protein F4778DRAFT_332867 [Xylariomycetidae sp. FL2044]|nr:hypothetical protein F4778DRAFT_332867 [Xylariomycetidae sp. FL2044]
MMFSKDQMSFSAKACYWLVLLVLLLVNACLHGNDLPTSNHGSAGQPLSPVLTGSLAPMPREAPRFDFSPLLLPPSRPLGRRCFYLMLRSDKGVRLERFAKSPLTPYPSCSGDLNHFTIAHKTSFASKGVQAYRQGMLSP